MASDKKAEATASAKISLSFRTQRKVLAVHRQGTSELCTELALHLVWAASARHHWLVAHWPLLRLLLSCVHCTLYTPGTLPGALAILALRMRVPVLVPVPTA
jgi:hypothetical protein